MADLLPSAPDTSAVEDADPRVIGVDSDDAADLLGALSSETARGLLAALHDDPANAAKLAKEVDTTIQNAQYHLGKLEEAGVIEVIDTVYSEKGREMKVYAPSDRPLVVVAGNDEETGTLRTALSRLLGGFSALAVSSIVVQELLGGGIGRVADALPDPPSFLGGEDLQDDEIEDDADPAPGETDDTAEYVSPDDDLDDAPEETGTPTPEDTPTPEETPTPAPEGTPTPAPEGTPTPAPEETPTPDGTPTPEATGTPTPADTPVPTGTPTPADTPVPTGTPTSVPTGTPTPMETTAPEMAPGAAEQVAALPPGVLFFAGGATILLGGFALWYLGWL